ncbi:hypothetical protein MRB53_035740 [Persea americana]|uniref:Uncharacterized protein n=1 Tax=Persea americana TaxID=3435 RepID=A0ACC2K5T1_PERAE|nr:hypothetical protein MRB53_035740 [Persea americana]
MDAKEASKSCVSEEREKSIYPMYFGVSCAFVALQLLSTAERSETNDTWWRVITDRMLQGSAHLLGLLVWKAQGGEATEARLELLNKLKKAETEVVELKRRRSEDAKANEKVMSIFASQEQNWINERKRLRQQIEALLKHLQVLDRKKEETISNLNQKTKDKEDIIVSKDKALEEEQKKREDVAEKLKIAEEAAEQLRETAKKEAQEHSSELWKHKTAFIELVSNQRQLEAEMGRALRQVEGMKQELDSVYEQKEEADVAVQNLSAEIVKMRKDVEQKDKILSAMLRKSKSDTAEKQMLLKEIKISKARRKQAELETERWRARCESRHDKSSKSNSSNRASSRSEPSIESECSQFRRAELHPTNNSLIPRTLLLDYFESEHRKELECINARRVNDTEIDSSSQRSPDGSGELVIAASVKQLEDWVQQETEKYISILEQRHYTEIEAFAEQMRLKDEKVEASRWRLLSMELESKRLQSHIESLDENLSQVREENMKLQTMLLDKENELKSLKEEFNLHTRHFQMSNSNYRLNPPAVGPKAAWSEVTVIKRKLKEKEQEQEAALVSCSQEVENEIQAIENEKADAEAKLVGTELQCEKEEEHHEIFYIDDVKRTEPTDSELSPDQIKDEKVAGIYEQLVEEFGKETPVEDPLQDASFANEGQKLEIEEVKELGVDTGHVPEDGGVVDKSASVGNYLMRKGYPLKMDLHALGVSFKIKRSKQQLVMLEKLAATQAFKKATTHEDAIDSAESCAKKCNNEDEQHIKGIRLLASLLTKQLKRYQSLEEKTDDLCKRMHENDCGGSVKSSSTGKTKVQIGTLEHFLEETFQLQRYMVATGQKLMELQSRIACIFVDNSESREPRGFDVRQFADGIRTLFREIQRGLEVRIARIIGDLEGTLACEGILNLRK